MTIFPANQLPSNNDFLRFSTIKPNKTVEVLHNMKTSN